VGVNYEVAQPVGGQNSHDGPVENLVLQDAVGPGLDDDVGLEAENPPVGGQDGPQQGPSLGALGGVEELFFFGELEEHRFARRLGQKGGLDGKDGRKPHLAVRCPRRHRGPHLHLVGVPVQGPCDAVDHMGRPLGLHFDAHGFGRYVGQDLHGVEVAMVLGTR